MHLGVPVLHLLSGLEIGGKEKVALQLARKARSEGHSHRLLLFDTPYRSAELDFDPEDVPWAFTPRKPGLDLSLPRRILGDARQHGISVIHAHNDSALVYASLTALLSRNRIKVVGTFHTWPSHPTRRARLATRLLGNLASAVTAVSEELRQRLLSEGWLSACVTVPNGADLAAFKPMAPATSWRQGLNLSPTDILVAQIGRLHPIKRAEDLIAAARLLRPTHPQIRFTLVGRGPHRAALEGLCADLDTVRILDPIADMPSFLSAVDVCALCSDQEAHPLVLLEAMAAGKAILATSVGGVPALLTDATRGLCGVLVAPREPAWLAAELRALAEDPARRAELGARALARVQEFSFEKSWSAYQQLYKGAESAAVVPGPL